MWQIDAGSSLLHITGSCFFFPLPNMTSTMCFASSSEHIRLASKPAGFSNITKKKISKCPQVLNQIRKSTIFFEIFEVVSIPSFRTFVRQNGSAACAFLRFKPYEVTNMLWAYAKLKEWNAQLFRCGNHFGWLVGGWWW